MLYTEKTFDNDLVGMHKRKASLTLNKTAYIGMCILELSKVLMHEFHYDYIKNKYDNNSKVLFTGIDSFKHEINVSCMKILAATL